MELDQILCKEAIFTNIRVSSKKQCLQILAQHAAQICGLQQEDIFGALLERERLGATGIGRGIAIPHAKLPDMDGLFCLFATLEKPIEFDVADEQPVDVLFLLLANEDAGADHLRALSRIARIFRDGERAEKIRNAHNADAIYMLLVENTNAFAA